MILVPSPFNGGRRDMFEFGLKPKTEAGVVPLQASKGFRDGVRFEPVMNFEATSWGNYVACT